MVEIVPALMHPWNGVRVGVSIALVGLATLLGGAARGEPDGGSGLDLRWRAPAACPDASAMRSRIVAAAGGANEARGVARARAAPAGDGRWTAWVDVGDGPRVLRGESCAEVAGAAALVIGIALRSAREQRPPRSAAQAGDPEVPWREPSIDAAAVAARVERRSPSRWRPSVTAQAGAMIGALPDPAPMARVGLALRRAAFAARVEAAAASSRRGLRLDAAEARVRIDLVAAAGSGCYAARWLWLCGGLEVGVMRGVASASDARVTGSGAWVAARAGPSTSLPLSPAVDLVLEADAAVPIAYPAFSVNGIALPGPDPVSLRTTLGVRVAIP